MYTLPALLAIPLLSPFTTAQRADGQFWPCNPIKNATGACTPNPGLATKSYTIDFTKQTSIPPDWTLSNYATVNFGPLGAEFTYAKRYDAPQLWTNFFIFFGRVDVTLRIANGTGMISSAVLMSDDFDEIDYEFSGNMFGKADWARGKGQNNYFGKGLTGNYDRGQYFDVSNPTSEFHTYSIDWTPDRLEWLLDGKIIRTFGYGQSSGDRGNYQYPQTPSKLQLGIWAGGDPGQNSGTKEWAGGTTDVTGGPYTMYVKSVSIQNMYPAKAYNWTDQSGKWQSIKVLQNAAIPVGGSSIATTGTSIKTSLISTSTTKPSSSPTSRPSTTSSATTSPTSKPTPTSTTKPTSTSTPKTSAPLPPNSSTKPITTPSSTKKSTSTSTSGKPTSTSSKPSTTYNTKPTAIGGVKKWHWNWQNWNWKDWLKNYNDEKNKQQGQKPKQYG